MKEEDFEQAKQMISLLKEKNSFLYDILTYRSMNAVVTQASPGRQSGGSRLYIPYHFQGCTADGVFAYLSGKK